jgi:hypothetical protein
MVAMQIFYPLATLENKIDNLIKTAENSIIKSLTGYEFYLNALCRFQRLIGVISVIYTLYWYSHGWQNAF